MSDIPYNIDAVCGICGKRGAYNINGVFRCSEHLSDWSPLENEEEESKDDE